MKSLKLPISIVIFFSILESAGSYEKISAEDTMYYFARIIIPQNTEEFQFFSEKHHFMTIVNQFGTFNLRPHPGRDINGWGSSLYLQPFLPGAVLQHSIIDTIHATDNGLYVKAYGSVSQGENSTYGKWSISMNFRFDSSHKKINGSGLYSILLDNVLCPETGDLNLFKISSNYLHNVPLVSGKKGDTGDMERVEVAGRNRTPFSWNPVEEPAYFPLDYTDSLSIYVKGQLNTMDTLKYGEDFSMAVAYKPSLKVIIENKNNPPVPMIFGAMYDTTKAERFNEDNVGITPLILDRSAKDLLFYVSFESETLPDDGTLPDTADVTYPDEYLSIYVNEVNEVETTFPNRLSVPQLYQNYPNPFNHVTMIQYYLPKAEKVEVTIFNQSGQKVLTLADSFQLPGYYHLLWNGTDAEGGLVSSGIYFYRLKTSKISRINKMVLVR